ncbi:hypothetical protein SARC_09066 [Sphaeroforma arctica JP610]|uniref:CCHC-type domain-containing protein n=1 Tax=Sphaeroforma arctica JP610 TaxID=667725 RepID=A0A0L0FR82_9EUKA|nr:hypothetical protein SARC_09066 [Sphaeroforma arctica JP610]KNC78508.1 hypothetical protein SARC_09066 [Sphaeroforma arctica JP610]|eukprot:XP_014152410.1 hypothetical protein SARC_09066 [Sphaeroforma arctica JP610]
MDKTKQALEEIRQRLLNVGECILDRYIICALMYGHPEDYRPLRTEVFKKDNENITTDDVYEMTLKYEGDNQIRTQPHLSGINAIRDEIEALKEHKPCLAFGLKGHNIYSCPTSVCHRCGVNDHMGKKCPVDRKTLICTQRDKPGHNADACLRK